MASLNCDAAASTKTYHLPLRLISAANSREHWAARARRVKRERAAAIVVRKHPLPCIVTIKRHGKRLMDGDNLQAACKALRDGIADRHVGSAGRIGGADPRAKGGRPQDHSSRPILRG